MGHSSKADKKHMFKIKLKAKLLVLPVGDNHLQKIFGNIIKSKLLYDLPCCLSIIRKI